MRAKCLNIRFSSKETKDPVPVFSLDFHKSGILATAAGDSKVQVCGCRSQWLSAYPARPRLRSQLWRLRRDAGGDTTLEHLQELNNGHVSPNVNCVRFSPCGHFLASAGDGGEFCLWTPALASDTGACTWRRQLMRGAHK